MAETAVMHSPVAGLRKYGAKRVNVNVKQPRCKQPKSKRNVKFVTTEIRCQEKTKGGVCYEVILAEPLDSATKPGNISPRVSREISVEEIEQKLRAAEERRMSFGASKMATWATKMSKIEEACRKRDEITAQFMTQTKQALEKKSEAHVKREAYINDLKNKMREHNETVEKTRLSLEQQTNEIKVAIEEKLKTANVQREENIKKMLERLREHEKQVQTVRATNAEKFQQLEAAINEKLDQAKTRREQYESEQLQKLKSHDRHVETVRQNKAMLANNEDPSAETCHV